MLLLLTILDGNTFAAGVNRSDPVPPTRSTEAYHTGCLHSFCARLSGSHVSSPSKLLDNPYIHRELPPRLTLPRMARPWGRLLVSHAPRPSRDASAEPRF